MADFSQTDRPLTISTPLGPDALLVAGFRGREAVSELFAFEFHLLAPIENPPVSFDSLLGQTVTASINVSNVSSSPRYLCGVVTSIREAERDKYFTHLHVTVRPAWWYATLRTNSRIFQQVTVVDILKTVLSPFGTIETQLTSTYPNRDYTCQYQETDYNFARRLLEEEGIFFSFKHEDGKLTLILADSLVNATAADISQLQYDTDTGTRSRDGDFRAWTWSKTQTVCPTAITTWDSTFELFRQNLEATANPPATASAGEVTQTIAPSGVGTIPVYFHEGDSAKRFDGVAPGGGDQSSQLQDVYTDARRVARLRGETLAASAVQLSGESNCPQLVPGTSFPLAGHFDGDGTYLVTAVDHSSEFTGTFRAAEPVTASYQNKFTACPMELVPRPARLTPRPRIGGPLTAVVVGPAGQQIFVDKYGRVKVQFLWDREGKFDANSSCWIRCAQLWSGNRWGAFFWPRIGMEVVVHFEDGDPDRPIVTGCVYNATNMPPTTLPDEASVGGVKSLIINGSPTTNFNAIYIHDTPGVEYIQIHSEQNQMQQNEAGQYNYTHDMVFDIRGHL